MAPQLVALLFTRSALLHQIDAVVRGLAASTTVAVLSGKGRRAERLAEDRALRRGLAVQAVLPARTGGHPADPLVRRADRVLIITGQPADAEVSPLLRLAQRYAKPTQVVHQVTGLGDQPPDPGGLAPAPDAWRPYRVNSENGRA